MSNADTVEQMADDIRERVRSGALTDYDQSPIDGTGPEYQGTSMSDDLSVGTTQYRLEQADRRLEKLEAIASDIRVALATLDAKVSALPGRKDVTGWGLAIILTILAAAIGLGGVLLTSSSNQIAAFSAGLSAAQSQPIHPGK